MFDLCEEDALLKMIWSKQEENLKQLKKNLNDCDCFVYWEYQKKGK